MIAKGHASKGPVKVQYKIARDPIGDRGRVSNSPISNNVRFLHFLTPLVMAFFCP